LANSSVVHRPTANSIEMGWPSLSIVGGSNSVLSRLDVGCAKTPTFAPCCSLIR
jgi:hypothetical protein